MKHTIKIKRIEKTDKVTRGVLLIDDVLYCTTLELPWKDNQRQISCIPEGEYPVRKHTSPNFGKCLAVDKVDGRSDILVHAGNTSKDTKGCVLVGQVFGELNGLPAVLQSKAALSGLLIKFKDNDELKLIVEG